MHFYKYTLLFLTSCTLAQHRFAAVDTLMLKAVQEKVFPGAQLLIWYKGAPVYNTDFGGYAYDAQATRVTGETLFDIASLTKLLTTTAMMLLCDAGLINLDDPVVKYIPEFGANGKDAVRIKHLLTHTSGLAYTVFFVKDKTIQESFKELYTAPLVHEPDKGFIYNDLDVILLPYIIARVTGQSFEQYVTEKILRPLGMSDTVFNPKDKQRCAPTGDSITRIGTNLQGVVNDDQSFFLGGVAGNAGLFSNVSDLAKFMDMIMHNGMYKGKQFIKSETVAAWARRQCNFNRGYGWEIGRHLSKDAFGHFGWTGTSIWADKEHEVCCILLTNRTATGSQPGNAEITKVRVALHVLIAQLFGLPVYVAPPAPAPSKLT